MKIIRLRNRQGQSVGRVKVDDGDYPELSQVKWHLHNGYAANTSWDPIAKKTKRVMMHRKILGLNNPTVWADHINRDRLDNRRKNLRTVNRTQNKQNGNRYKGSKSRFRGVSWRNDRNLWVATARIDGTSHYIGSSKSEAEAGAMASAWRKVHMPYSDMDQT